jgi:hypothetical protein
VANWDFCSICNSGKHCHFHDTCDCFPAPGLDKSTPNNTTLQNYSNEEIEIEYKRRKNAVIKEKIKELKKQIELLKGQIL